MRQFADCVVLVGPAHAPALRRWEAAHPPDGTTFVPVPEARWPAPARRGRFAWFAAYLRWLRRAYAAGMRLHAQHAFDLVYHATYSTYWLPTPAVRFGVPSVWGPVGGAVTTPRRLWPLLGWRGVLDEWLDRVAVRACASLPAVRRTTSRVTQRLVQNEATLARLPASHRPGTLVLNHALFTDGGGTSSAHPGGFLLFAGALEPRKGARLALRALAHTPADVRLVVAGDGPDRRPLERLSRRLGVAERVEFRGRVSRAAILRLLTEATAAVFTGLREEGGLALAEAMLAGTPVIVLAHGGARTIAECATDPSRVALVAPGTVDVTVRRVAEAMTRFSRRPARDVGSLLDQQAATRRLQDVVEAALASRLQPVALELDPQDR